MSAHRAVRTALVLLALGLAGCASAAGQPVTSIDVLEGKWQGTITVGMGAPQFYYLTVNPDATIVATWGLNWQWGNITLSGGRVRFELDHLTSGTILYYEGSDGRSIQMTPDFGGWYVWATPLK
ncbi:MAG TPA: hypothetical protein VF948_07210 [Methylomirabilota bacterium]